LFVADTIDMTRLKAASLSLFVLLFHRVVSQQQQGSKILNFFQVGPIWCSVRKVTLGLRYSCLKSQKVTRKLFVHDMSNLLKWSKITDQGSQNHMLDVAAEAE